jgi:hypothetical protein
LLATFANAKLASFCSLTLAVLAEARIRPETAIDDCLLAIDVDEPLQRQGCSHDIARQVLDGARVLRRDRLSDVRRDTWMLPSHQLLAQLLRDGVFLDEPRQEPLAKEPHQRLAVPGRERVKRPVVREGAGRHQEVSM